MAAGQWGSAVRSADPGWADHCAPGSPWASGSIGEGCNCGTGNGAATLRTMCSDMGLERTTGAVTATPVMASKQNDGRHDSPEVKSSARSQIGSSLLLKKRSVHRTMGWVPCRTSRAASSIRRRLTQRWTCRANMEKKQPLASQRSALRPQHGVVLLLRRNLRRRALAGPGDPASFEWHPPFQSCLVDRPPRWHRSP